MRKYIFMLMAMISQPSFASNAGPGKVVIPIVDRAGKFFFNHTGSRGARPACGFYDRWAVDVNIPKGQSMMSLILTAYSQGKSISVVGSNECGDAGDTEGIAYVMVND